jgi:hypothetical protein
MESAADKDAARSATTAADKDALKALDFDWGEAYVIVHEGGCWQAGRRDSPGHMLTASDPEQLRAAVRADYELRPVPRDLPGMTS